MPITEPLGTRYIVPADEMPISAQWRQLERALDHVCSDEPGSQHGIAPALAYIDAMQFRLTELRAILVSMQEKARKE